ncbi:Hypothetical protein PBC10988_37750 [Planctomycetales bacterium 10988]|nr:Hypothetical protein PBC10988_37750 [Planctomycetales bacterium 10988]
MINFSRLLAFTVLLVVGGFQTATAHPFHATLAEGHWNEESKTLEVSLWVPSHDLEKLLLKRTGIQNLLDQGKPADQAIHSYLKETIQWREKPQGKPVPLKWIGKEVSVEETWLYFEIQLTQEPGGVLEYRLFFEQEPEQQNSIEIIKGQQKTTLHFHREQPSRPVRFAPLLR